MSNYLASGLQQGWDSGNQMVMQRLKQKFEAEQLQKQLDAEAAVRAANARAANAGAARTEALTPGEQAELDARANNLAAGTDNTRANTERTRNLTPAERAELDARVGNIMANTQRTQTLTPEEAAGERARTAATIAGAQRTVELTPAEKAQMEAQAAALAGKNDKGSQIVENDPITGEPLSMKTITPFSAAAGAPSSQKPAADPYTTPDQVRAAYQAKKLTREQASQMLRSKFGLK